MSVFVLILEYDNGRYGTDSRVAGVFATKSEAEQAGKKELEVKSFNPPESYYTEEFDLTGSR